MTETKNKAVNSLLFPISKQTFKDTLYEKTWKFFEDSSNDLSSLFTVDDIEDYLFKSKLWVTETPLLDAGIILAKHPNGGAKPEGITTVEELLGKFNDGHSLVIQSAHKRHSKLADFCSQLSENLNCMVNANIYITPPNNQGFSAHYDMHDVFLLQTAGAKIWKVKPFKEVQLSIKDDNFSDEYKKVDLEKDTQDSTKITLKAGQRLYIPRGTIHEGVAVADTLSIHVTFGLEPIIWDDIILFLTSNPNQRDGNHLCKSVPFDVLKDLSSKTSIEAIKDKIAHFNYDDIDQNISKFLINRIGAIKPHNRFEAVNQINSISINSSIRIIQKTGIQIVSNKYISFYGEQKLIPPEFICYVEEAIQLNFFCLNKLLNISTNEKSIIAFSKWLITSGYAVLITTQG